jgi:hypothetical protein
MKTTFIQPRFEGPRFAEHTLPLDVVGDLAAYETLLVELAKHLYLQEHPERQRVPKGFASDFQLHLQKVDEGSARPLLALIIAGSLNLSGGAGNHFERARDLITECVAAPENQLPPAFPRELLSHFNQVGRSLADDERMEMTTASGKLAVLTPERRKRLVLAASNVYERPVELIGMIAEANWEKSTFQLRQQSGDTGLVVVPMSADFHAKARKYGGCPRHQITVQAVGAYDSWDRLQKVVSVTSLEIQPDYQLATRFEELSALNDGWHDGQGRALDAGHLDRIASKLVGYYPDSIPLPLIVPTPEGNLLFEWHVAGYPSLDIDLTAMTADYHAFHSEKGDIEESFPLTEAEGWSQLLTFLTTNLGQFTV